jgi:hypothetical protein
MKNPRPSIVSRSKVLVDMNDDVHNSDFDSLLVLLPGSTINPEGIRFLSEISGFDHFFIQNKLKIKLPHILCPVSSHEITGSSGDLLENLCINYLAVKKTFYALPFNPVRVFSCLFETNRSRFYSSHHDPVDIYNKENILLIEGSYKTTDETMSYLPGNELNSGAGQKKSKAVNSNDLKTYRFIMLYQVMDPGPLVFIDRFMDYSFMGSAKKTTVTDNFNVMKALLEKTFCCKTDQALLLNGFLFEHGQQLSEQKTKRFRLKGGKEMITTAISNEAASNHVSRLLFYQWCKDNGWINRIMPKVS